MKVPMQPSGHNPFLREEEDGVNKGIVSMASAVLGVCLIGSSFFVPYSSDAHALFADIFQLMFFLAGCLAITAAVITFFLRKTPDIFM